MQVHVSIRVTGAYNTPDATAQVTESISGTGEKLGTQTQEQIEKLEDALPRLVQDAQGRVLDQLNEWGTAARARRAGERHAAAIAEAT